MTGSNSGVEHYWSKCGLGVQCMLPEVGKSFGRSFADCFARGTVAVWDVGMRSFGLNWRTNALKYFCHVKREFSNPAKIPSRQPQPALFAFLSDLGRRLFQPVELPAQVAEAQRLATRFDVSVGVAKSRGVLMDSGLWRLAAAVEPSAGLAYASICGDAALRHAWLNKFLRQHAGFRPDLITLPVVTNGVSNALSLAFSMLVNPKDVVLLPSPRWPNYDFMAGVICGATLKSYPLFDEARRFNLEGLREAILGILRRRRRLHILLNFPHNPTGYSLTEVEASQLVDTLGGLAEHGAFSVICDDAYFGLFHSKDCDRASIFSRLATCHPNITTVRADGATKEFFAWGLRIGFLTFALFPQASTAEARATMEGKIAGAIRATLGSCQTFGQQLLVMALQSPEVQQRLEELRQELTLRWEGVRRILAGNPEYDGVWQVHPFNSGYYVCLRLTGVNAEPVRRRLLRHYGIGTTAFGEQDLRIAYSCVENEDLPELFALTYRAVWESRATGKLPIKQKNYDDI